MPECLFCKIVEGKVPSQKVTETESVLAFRDIRPQAPTHVLLIPKRHVAESAADLGRSEPGLERFVRRRTAKKLSKRLVALPCRLDDVGARAGEIGADVGRAAFGAPDDIAVGGRKGGPAAGAAAIDAKHEFHAISPRPG